MNLKELIPATKDFLEEIEVFDLLEEGYELEFNEELDDEFEYLF